MAGPHSRVRTPSTNDSTRPRKTVGAMARALCVKASPGDLFDALTTVEGLVAWWNPASGSGERGGELRFIMNAPEPLVIHVDEATRPTVVRWTSSTVLS